LGFALRETSLNVFFAGTVALALPGGTFCWKVVVIRPVLQFFGEISYGFDLIHLVVFDLVNRFAGGLFSGLIPVCGHFGAMVFLFSITAGVTAAIAYLYRWYFEAPFLRLKRRFEGLVTEPVAAPGTAGRLLQSRSRARISRVAVYFPRIGKQGRVYSANASSIYEIEVPPHSAGAACCGRIRHARSRAFSAGGGSQRFHFALYTIQGPGEGIGSLQPGGASAALAYRGR
jgi:hypothetical protein